MTTRPARSCAYCDELEGDLLRLRVRSEALRLRIQRVVEKMADDVARSVADGDAPIRPVGPVEHYRDLLIEAMGEHLVDLAEEDTCKSTPDTVPTP